MASVSLFDPIRLRRERALDVVARRAIDLSARDLVYGPRDSLAEHVLELVDLVGGLDVLSSLDDAPLPDEPFDWASAGLTQRAFVTEVLGLADAACDALFDVEIRTVARRLLVRAVRGGAPPWRHDAKAVRVAAGLVWLAAKGNGRLGKHAGLYAKGLWQHFGVTDSSSIGDAIARAAVPDRTRYASWWLERQVEWLGDVTLLTGGMRAAILRRLDEILDVAAHEAGQRVSLRRRGFGGGGSWDHFRALRYGVRRVFKAADDARRAFVAIELGEGAVARVIALSLADAFELREMLDVALSLSPPGASWPSGV